MLITQVWLSFQATAQAQNEAPLLGSAASYDTIPLPVSEIDSPGPANTAHQLDTVTVVATRTERAIDQVPQSVTVLSAQEMAVIQAQDLGDLLSEVSGVELLGGPRADAENLVIRGLGGISGTRVTLLVDGARQGLDRGVLSRLNVDPSLLKTAEILKGPASLLYGSGALAGVVALTTKNADDLLAEGRNFGARLRLSDQDAYQSRNLGGALFGRFGDFDLLGDFNTRSTEDFRQGGGTIMPLSAQNNDGDLFKLGWYPGGAHQLRLSSTGYRTQTVAPGNPQQPVTEDTVPRRRDSGQRFSNLSYGFDPGWDGVFRDLSLQINQSDYSATEEQLAPPEEGTVADDGTLPSAVVETVNGVLAQVLNGGEEPEPPPPPTIFDLVSRGGNLITGLEMPWWSGRLSIGADWAEDVGSARAGGEPINNFPDAKQSIMGVFIQQELDLLDNLGLIGGLRYDQYKNTPAEHIDAEPIEEDAVSLQIGGTFGLAELLGRWLGEGWGEGLTISALYGEAFRAPSLREAYSFGTHFLGNEFVINPNLRPEKAANKEISLRYRPKTGLGPLDRFNLSLTGFQNDIRDFMELIVTVEVEGPFPPAVQCVSPVPPQGCVNRNNPTAPPIFIGGDTTTINLPEARLRGLEFEIEAGLGWIESSLKYARVRGTDRESGHPLWAIPADTLSLNLGGRWGELFSGLNITRTADQDRVPPPAEDRIAISTPSKGYTVLNWRTLWTPKQGWLGGAYLSFAIDNLTDKRYRNHLTFDHEHFEVGRNVKASIALPL